MGQTVIEKIIGQHLRNGSPRDVKPFDIVWIEIDVRSARDFGGANVVKQIEQVYQDLPLKEQVADPARTFFTFDCNAPANNIPYANNQQVCRNFARRHDIRVFDVDMGIGSHVLMEFLIARPGMIVVGTDSHMNILGAICALGQGMGNDDIAFVFKTGRTWFEVPETIQISLKGIPGPAYVEAKDVALYVLKHLGTEGALGCALEYRGDYFSSLSMDDRITIASLATEMGAIVAFLPYTPVVETFYQKRGVTPLPAIVADSDAVYKDRLEIDISNLRPQIAVPFSPANVCEVREVEGVTIDSVFIGSCTNGRLTDIARANQILTGRRIFERVMVKIVPATREVYKEIVDKGYLASLFEAGAIISACGCGGCASGQLGMTGTGEIQVSTSNRNFEGKQGAGKTYLASPSTAAVSALRGKITCPSRFFEEGA